MHVQNLTDLIYAGIKTTTNNKPRSHLGASTIGHPCERKLWMDFRWIMREDFNGRILRLFRRGQDEEAPLIKDLRAAGLKIDAVNPTTKKQFGFSDGFFAGSCDGIILSGVPEAPTKKHVFEAKTHSLKSYKDVEKNGVEKSKPMHYVQMQVYMGAFGIDRALYVAVCKDDDQIYTERVRYDASVFEWANTRAQRIIASDRMPEPLSADPSWHECKYCSAYAVCHKGSIAQDVHCRTCSNVTFQRDGKVHCAKWDCEVPDVDAQMAGCDGHILHPDLVPWAMVIDNGKVSWHVDTDCDVRNGEPDFDVFTSKEILANVNACISMREDKFAQDARMELGGRIVSA